MTKPTRKPLGECTILFAFILLFSAAAYAGAATWAWGWRHPRADRAAFWREMPAVLMFNRLERYE